VCQYAGSKYHGMGFRQYYLARELVKYGYEVYVITSSFSHQFTSLPEINGIFTHEIIDGINYVWVRVPKYKSSKSIGRVFSMFFFMLNLFRMKVRSLPKPFVIVVSSPSLFPILNARRWARKTNAQLILEVRDIWPLTLIELGRFDGSNPFILFMQWFENYAYKKSDYVVSVLPLAESHMIAHGLSKDRFIYIPNGIHLEDLERKTVLSSDYKRQIPQRRFVVGYAGAVGIANALDSLIDAAELLTEHKEICILVVGNGGEKKRLQKKAKHLENVFFLDAVPKSQVHTLLEYFDVCYIGLKNVPLFRFGVSPNKLFDYMRAGKPVVYAINSGNDPVQEAGCGLSVEAENPSAIADAIVKLYEMDLEERNSMGENGKEYVMEHHSYTRLAKKYIELLKR
jgi:glycosyltransferase involved in cell wall biosynthesis